MRHMAECGTETNAMHHINSELDKLWSHHGMTKTVLEFGEWEREEGTLYWTE